MEEFRFQKKREDQTIFIQVDGEQIWKSSDMTMILQYM